MATPTSEAVQTFLMGLRQTVKDKAYLEWSLAARQQYATLRLRQDKEIRGFYVKMAKELAARVEIARRSGSGDLERLLGLDQSLQETITAIDGGLTGLFRGYIAEAADIGSTPMSGALLTISSQAGAGISSIITPSGIQIIKARANNAAIEAIWSRSTDGLFLSKRIWGTSERTAKSLQQIIRTSVALGDDAVETSRKLDKYVRGGARTFATQYPKMLERMNSTWPKGMTFMEAKTQGLLKPGAVRVPSDVCYESLRLARTETSAAFGEGTIASARMAPSYEGMRWLISSSHPEQDVCDSLASADFGQGAGVYPPGDEPHQPAHPNCLCCLVQVHEDPDEMVKRLKGWVNDPAADPELELWHRRVYRGLPEDVAAKGLELPAARVEHAEKVGWVQPGVLAQSASRR